MKTYNKFALMMLVMILAVAAFLAMPARAQTNALEVAPPSSLSSTLAALSTVGTFLKPLTAASNWIIAPYATYAPEIKAKDKIGGGVLAIYNVNNYVGAGLGVDYLGQFSLVSGNVELKLPTHPLAFIGSPWATNFTATPFAIGGIATPLGGAGDDNGGISTIEGAGLGVKAFHLWGGDVDVGLAYVNWTSAGDYSGTHYQAFLAWHHGF